MKKFKVTAIRTDEYIIEMDETIYNDEWMKVFSSYMWEVEDHKPLVEALAHHQLRMGSEGTARFIEGFGNVLRDARRPFSREDYDANGKQLPNSQLPEFALGLNIIINSEDEDYEFEIEEIIKEEPQQ